MAAQVELTIDQEFAGLLPALTCEQRAILEANLSAEGWRKEQAIIVWANHDNTIVDGHNRYAICLSLGIEFRVISKVFEDREAVKEWIYLNAIGQRNLTAEKEAYCRGEVYNIRKKRRGGREDRDLWGGQSDHPKTADVVAEEFGVSEATVRRDAKFAEAVNAIAEEVGDASFKQDVLAGAISASKSDLIRLGKLEPAQQKAIVAAARGGEPIKTLIANEVAATPKHIFSVDDDAVCTSDLAELVGKKFGCIYADPPWAYSNQGTRAATDNHYSTMTVDDLCELPIASLAADDSHLHLWTTNAFLFDAKRVIEAWGFEYKSLFVWVKSQMGIGNYWRVSHEILLTAVRGDATRFNAKNLKSWQEFKRSKHSAKPEKIRHMLEKASTGPYLELFGRKQTRGWTVFGNQVKKMECTLFVDGHTDGVLRTA